MFSSADWSIYVKVKSIPTLQFTGLNSLWGLEAVYNLTNDGILFFFWFVYTTSVNLSFISESYCDGNVLLVYARYSVVIYTWTNSSEHFKILSINSSLYV